MSMKPISQYYSVSAGLTTVALAATKTTVAFDLANVIENMTVFQYGAYTDGSFAWTAQDSADNTTYATCAAGDLIFGVPTTTAFAAVAAATTSCVKVSYIGSKRYIRFVATATTATAGILANVAYVAKYHKLPMNP